MDGDVLGGHGLLLMQRAKAAIRCGCWDATKADILLGFLAR